MSKNTKAEIETDIVTLIPCLDEALGGHLRRKGITLIVGETGKTALAVEMAIGMLWQSADGIFVTTGDADIERRMIESNCGISQREFNASPARWTAEQCQAYCNFKYHMDANALCVLKFKKEIEAGGELAAAIKLELQTRDERTAFNDFLIVDGVGSVFCENRGLSKQAVFDFTEIAVRRLQRAVAERNMHTIITIAESSLDFRGNPATHAQHPLWATAENVICVKENARPGNDNRPANLVLDVIKARHGAPTFLSLVVRPGEFSSHQ